MKDRVRSVRVVVDYPAVVATGASHLIPLVAILAVEGTTISADIAPVTTSIFDIASVLGGVLLTGITPISSTLGT
jgi:hypothetical protein